MQSTKNRKTNHNIDQNKKKRLFLCFRPVVTDGLQGHGLEKGGDHGGGGDPVFEYVKLEHKDGAVFPQISPANLASSDKESIAYSEKKGRRKNFARLLKAILFETSLAKKIKKRKVSQKLIQSEKVKKDPDSEKKSSINSKDQEVVKKDDGRNISNRTSSHSSLWSSSSSLVSSNSGSSSDTNRSFRSNLTEIKLIKQDNIQGNGKGYYSSTIGLCLLLVSLMVLVFWGRACAIICTSTWLFFVPHMSKARKNLSQKIVDYEGIDSDEYKKKIIMEGLLDRNRSRLHYFDKQ